METSPTNTPFEIEGFVGTSRADGKILWIDTEDGPFEISCPVGLFHLHAKTVRLKIEILPDPELSDREQFLQDIDVLRRTSPGDAFEVIQHWRTTAAMVGVAVPPPLPDDPFGDQLGEWLWDLAEKVRAAANLPSRE